MLAATVLQCLFWLALALLQCTVGDQHPLSSGLGLEEPLLPDTEAGHTAAPYFVGTVRHCSSQPVTLLSAPHLCHTGR